MKYYVTYSIFNEESAEHGEYAEYGDIGDTESLATAIDWLNSTRTSECDGVVSMSGHYAEHGKRMTIAIFNGMEYRTGDTEQRSLHCHGISKASANRIAKLIVVNLDTF